jgi:hypothetical protein
MSKYLVPLALSAVLLIGCVPGKNTPAPTPATSQTPSPTEEVTVITPAANQLLKSPQRIHGKAPGTWFFEANVVVKLLDEHGAVLAQNRGQAKGEWMTEQPVEFESKLIFTVPAGQTKGTLVIENDNPSGLPENQKSYSVPVRLR